MPTISNLVRPVENLRLAPASVRAASAKAQVQLPDDIWYAIARAGGPNTTLQLSQLDRGKRDALLQPGFVRSVLLYHGASASSLPAVNDPQAKSALLRELYAEHYLAHHKNTTLGNSQFDLLMGETTVAKHTFVARVADGAAERCRTFVLDIGQPGASWHPLPASSKDEEILSPDGHWLARSDARGVSVFDVHTSEPARSGKRLLPRRADVCFSANGAFLFAHTGSAQGARIDRFALGAGYAHHTGHWLDIGYAENFLAALDVHYSPLGKFAVTINHNSKQLLLFDFSKQAPPVVLQDTLLTNVRHFAFSGEEATLSILYDDCQAQIFDLLRPAAAPTLFVAQNPLFTEVVGARDGLFLTSFSRSARMRYFQYCLPDGTAASPSILFDHDVNFEAHAIDLFADRAFVVTSANTYAYFTIDLSQTTPQINALGKPNQHHATFSLAAGRIIGPKTFWSYSENRANAAAQLAIFPLAAAASVPSAPVRFTGCVSDGIAQAQASTLGTTLLVQLNDGRVRLQPLPQGN